MSIQIRPYTPNDRAAVRHICCETGFSGNPIDPLFSDREVFADFFTRYYTDYEPESAFIAEEAGQVVGYLLGCRNIHAQPRIEARLLWTSIVPKVCVRLLTGRYNAASRRFLWWCCVKGPKETPSVPKGAAHFHFNLLPPYRNRGLGKKFFFRFLRMIENDGLPGVYGQIQITDDRRPLRVFEKFGFTLYDQREITRFRGHHERRVYVATLYREFV